MPKRIPIKALKDFSSKFGLTHAILYAHDGRLNHIVTYGKNVEQCSQAADFGNKMKDLLGWPRKLHAQPSRVKKLQGENKSLREKLKRISKVIEDVDDRCLNYDGSVGRTLDEMTQEEMSEIYRLAND